MKINDITERIIGAAIDVHREPGPGLLGSIYENALCKEFDLIGLCYERQCALPVVYKGFELDCGFRIDLVVENEVILELKAIEELLPLHEAQLLTYLKLSGKQVGLPINFNVPILKQGIRRLVNHLREDSAASASRR